MSFPRVFSSLLRIAGAFGLLVLAGAGLRAGQSEQPVSVAKDRHLVYVADANGNRVPDFSSAGYGGGGVALPEAAVRVAVTPVEGDNGPRIQAALDYVAGLAPDATGLRGAVLLQKGRYPIAGHIKIPASGVILRGEGAGAGETVLLATGTDRRALIEVRGAEDRKLVGKRVTVAANYVPVGATVLKVAGDVKFTVGDRVRITRPSPKSWFEQIGMADAPARSGFFWRPNTLDVVWDRTVVAFKGDELTLDAPLTTALEAKYGGGTVEVYQWPGRVSRVGIEHLRCESAFDKTNARDEQHSWIGVRLDGVEDAWVRDVVFAHFAGSAVYVAEGARRITVADCASVDPVSEIAGYRRHTFFTAGQQTLFLRCKSDNGQHDFVTGYLAAGPNVFLNCVATAPHGFSGSVGSWASGILFDNVNIDGGDLRIDNLETWNQGVGWAAANSVVWQSKASRLICRVPPGAANWASGVWSMFVGDGHWSKSSEFVDPDSLYVAQLEERLGKKALSALAAAPVPLTVAGAPKFDAVVKTTAVRPVESTASMAKTGLALQNGWLVSDGRLVIGDESEVTWWRGQLLPARAGEEGPSLTRFVPGRSGPGLTDDLDQLTDAMVAAHRVALRHHWGLWYDRRSDDHQMVRRPDADVWPPFFEQPWLRSGQGEAWDRLSRYDLSKYNPWYFGRLHEFADLARAKGLILVNEMYFQHNILEAGAHWASFPWRPANCLQETGFPEPPPYFEDKRNFMAETFYDLSNPVRREIHRSYIRQCLTNLADEPNVIHTTGAEFSGPLHFAQFWFDTVADWEAETSRRPLIALSASKDVQDAILADTKRSATVGVIDFTYWWRTDKNTFAPNGGQNLSPRQSERLWKGGKPSAVSLARMVREYRARFPDKAVITSLNQSNPWAFVAAGGSRPNLPASTDVHLLDSIPAMHTVGPNDSTKVWVLGETGKQYFVFASDTASATIDLSGEQGTYRARRIDLKTGKVAEPAETISAGKTVQLPTAASGATAIWLTR